MTERYYRIAVMKDDEPEWTYESDDADETLMAFAQLLSDPDGDVCVAVFRDDVSLTPWASKNLESWETIAARMGGREYRYDEKTGHSVEFSDSKAAREFARVVRSHVHDHASVDVFVREGDRGRTWIYRIFWTDPTIGPYSK